MKPAWSLTKEAWESLLLALDSDPDAAAKKYQVLHQKLVRFFEWRGTDSPEDRADQTVDRVARKLHEGEPIEEISSYAYGVARMVLLEANKERAKVQIAAEELPPPITLLEEPADNDPRMECFERCIKNLPADTREMIVTYYIDEKGAKIENRKSLAEKLGIPLNALRIRAHRVRAKLEECVTGCVASSRT